LVKELNVIDEQYHWAEKLLENEPDFLNSGVTGDEYWMFE